MTKPKIIKDTSKRIIKCKHEWELSHTVWQYPVGWSRTSWLMEEYGYFICKKCLMIIKRRVEFETPSLLKGKDK